MNCKKQKLKNKEAIDTIFNSLEKETYWNKYDTFFYFITKLLEDKDAILKDFLFEHFSNSYESKYNTTPIEADKQVDRLLEYLERATPIYRYKLVQYIFSKLCLHRSAEFSKELLRYFILELKQQECLDVIQELFDSKQITIQELADAYAYVKYELYRDEE